MGQLVYMALYLEHAIKYDLSEAHNLDKVGPGDMMSQLIQVNQSTTTKTLFCRTSERTCRTLLLRNRDWSSGEKMKTSAE